MDMNDKVVIITGAAQGIGLACAEAFAKSGAISILIDVKDAARRAQDIVEAGYKAESYLCDVSDSKSVKETIHKITQKYGRIDAAVNNAVSARQTMKVAFLP